MPISGYGRKLAPPGDEPYARPTWTGPASYVQVGTTPVTAGLPPTGGDPIAALTLGVNAIVTIAASATYTGNFLIVPLRISSAKWTFKWISLVTGTVGGQSQTAFTEAATGTNLTTETFKFVVYTISG
jgi:hypothetical protein